MGGNNSRLINPNGGDALPAKIRPLLGQRFEEFRKRRSNVQGEDAELSKKQLLKDNDGSSEGKCSDQNEVPEETQLQKEQPTIISAVAVEKVSQVVPLPVSERGNEEKEKEKEEEKGHKDHDRIIDKDVEKKTDEVSIQETLYEKAKTKHEEKEEESDEEEEDEDDIGRRIGPGSPSFKIYCTESDEKKEQELPDTRAGGEKVLVKEDQNIAVHNKSHSTDDSDESEVSESENTSNSNEVIKEPSPKKKGHHKRKKLEAMKKNLINVKNLQKNRMNRMMGCAGNDRRSLLADN